MFVSYLGAYLGEYPVDVSADAGVDAGPAGGAAGRGSVRDHAEDHPVVGSGRDAHERPARVPAAGVLPRHAARANLRFVDLPAHAFVHIRAALDVYYWYSYF